MSAHLCKQIYTSWRQARHASPDGSPIGSPPSNMGSYFPSQEGKRSMDNDRHETSPNPPDSRQSASSSGSPNWRWGSR